jgi:protein gp37
MPARDWWDTTWNPVGGCKAVSTGCKNCYLATWLASHTHQSETVHAGVIKRVKGRWVFNGKLKTLPDGHHAWNKPLEYPGAESPKLGTGKPSLILTAAGGDLFVEGRSTNDIDRVVETIALSPHIGLFLSKYTGQMAPYFLNKSPFTVECWRRNIWLGFSAERQIEFDIRWVHMRPLAEVGWFVFTSLAPLLKQILLPEDFLAFGKRTWVIVNGEGEGASRHSSL